MIEVWIRHRYHSGPGLPDLDVDFATPSAGITVLFGPSGAGKSSAISALAGLLRPVEGRLALDGHVLCETATRTWVPPEARRIGVVFQDSRLFPHLSVGGNLRYGARRAPAGQIAFETVTTLLAIAPLLGRRPHTLSGGERQRVAIGRALLSQPRLLLMDEPLASLDPARITMIMPYLAALRRTLAVPIIYVTHRIEELATLADNVVVFAEGRVRASGPVAELSTRADLGLALPAIAGAVLDAEVLRHDRERRLSELRLGRAGKLVVALQELPVGAPVRLRVPAGDLILAVDDPGETSAQNRLRGRVRRIVARPAHESLVELEHDDFALLARITPDAVDRLGLAPGRPVTVLLKSTAIQVLST